MELLENIKTALAAADYNKAVAAVESAVDAGLEPITIVNEGCEPGMTMLGERFNTGEAFVPQLMIAGKAMTAALDLLFPPDKVTGEQRKKLGKVVIGTVKGDRHDIGKNLVSIMISVAGFDVTDLGTDVPHKTIIEEAEKIGADIIATSALLTSTMYYQKELIRYAVDRGVRDKFFFIIGGAPVTPTFCDDTGADGWSKSAAGAPILCKKLMEEGYKAPLAEPVIIHK